jgi:hypothetical protein
VFVGLFLCGVVVYLMFARAMFSISIAFADEQTAIFEEMADKAATALSQDPPDVAEAIGCLQYVHHYYPSGTKQLSGSRLDQIVERSRTAAGQRIIEQLRAATGQDFGDEPDRWIDEYPELGTTDTQ